MCWQMVGKWASSTYERHLWDDTRRAWGKKGQPSHPSWPRSSAPHWNGAKSGEAHAQRFSLRAILAYLHQNLSVFEHALLDNLNTLFVQLWTLCDIVNSERHGRLKNRALSAGFHTILRRCRTVSPHARSLPESAFSHDPTAGCLLCANVYGVQSCHLDSALNYWWVLCSLPALSNVMLIMWRL